MAINSPIGIVEAANHCQNLCILGIQDYDGRVICVVVGLSQRPVLPGEFLYLLLHFQVDRGDYLKATPVDHVAAVLLYQPVARIEDKMGVYHIKPREGNDQRCLLGGPSVLL